MSVMESSPQHWKVPLMHIMLLNQILIGCSILRVKITEHWLVNFKLMRRQLTCPIYMVSNKNATCIHMTSHNFGMTWKGSANSKWLLITHYSKPADGGKFWSLHCKLYGQHWESWWSKSEINIKFFFCCFAEKEEEIQNIQTLASDPLAGSVSE